jgi:TolA-binding protein
MIERVEPLPADVASLLDAERWRPGPAAATRQRLWARVNASLVAPAPAGAAPATSANGVTSLATAGKVALATAALSAAAVGLVGTRDPAPPPAPPPRAAIASPTASAAPAAPFAPIPEPRPPSPPDARPAGAASRRAAATPGPSRPAPRDTLTLERALLQVAHADLASGRLAPARTALAEHLARFPRGRLAEERESLWIQALAQSGDLEGARARLERFRAAFPHSIFRGALEEALRGTRR